MRKEIYEMLCSRLMSVEGVKHVDLWNHNVEFIEMEESWARPAVFVEFRPIKWEAQKPGVFYLASVVVNLHVVSDWNGSSAADSELRAETLEVFDLLERIHRALAGVDGKTFHRFDLVGSTTNHNHEDIVENVETYECVGFRDLEEDVDE